MLSLVHVEFQILIKIFLGATDKGRPVYYVVNEEPDSLHSDRSPYYFEPADTDTSILTHGQLDRNSFIQQQQQQHQIRQPSASDFTIQEHTYQMCPECPSFQIPVPIPKNTLPQQQQQQHGYNSNNNIRGGSSDSTAAAPTTDKKELNYFEQISNSMLSKLTDIQNKAISGIFDPVQRLLGVSPDEEEEDQEEDNNQSLGSYTNAVEKQDHAVDESAAAATGGMSPAVVAGMAAMAVGGMALLSSAATLAGSVPAGAGKKRRKRDADGGQELLQHDLNCKMFKHCQSMEFVLRASEGLERCVRCCSGNSSKTGVYS